jgi:zinc protease
LAHLFEHLMFGETETLAKGEFDRRIEAVGAAMNAATWLDWTHYHETFLPEHLERIAALEAERTARLVLGEEQVAREKEVVANERRFRVDNSVEGAASELMWKLAFERHPYHHPTIGWMEDILGFTVEDCRAFYRTYYAPNDATLVVVGPQAEEEVIGILTRTHGGMAPQVLPEPEMPEEPAQEAPREARLRWTTPTAKVGLAWKSPALADPLHAPLTVLAQVLFGGRSGRLQRKLVHDGEIASGVGGGPGGFRDPSLFEVWVDLREGRAAAEAAATVLAELEALRTTPPTAEELEIARNQVLLGFRSALETAAGRAERIGHFHVTAGSAAAIATRQAALLAVSAEEARAAAAACFDDRRRTTVWVDPTEEAS